MDHHQPTPSRIAPGPPIGSLSRLSERFAFLDDYDHLVVVSGDQERQRDVERALAFGLPWQVDRDLVLELPQDKLVPALHRPALLRLGVHVFGHDQRTHNGARIILLIDGYDVRVIHAATGEIIRQLTINPEHRYHGTGKPPGGPRRPYGPHNNKKPEP